MSMMVHRHFEVKEDNQKEAPREKSVLFPDEGKRKSVLFPEVEEGHDMAEDEEPEELAVRKRGRPRKTEF